MDKEKQLYEIAYLISPAYSEEEAQNYQQTLKNLIQEEGGLVDHEGGVEKKRLSYPIKKMREAHLGSFRFLLSAGKIEKIEAKLKSSKEVLRHILVHTKRQPPRSVRAPVFAHSRSAADTPKKYEQRQTEAAEPAANIEEIDKKLEEILGK